jgi:prevent-host-death family protein
MQSVGARELKQHTGEVIARVRAGERLLLTVRGRPVAIIAPIHQQSLDAAISGKTSRDEPEGWLAATEGNFAFWNNEEDAVWDSVPIS